MAPNPSSPTVSENRCHPSRGDDVPAVTYVKCMRVYQVVVHILWLLVYCSVSCRDRVVEIESCCIWRPIHIKTANVILGDSPPIYINTQPWTIQDTKPRSPYSLHGNQSLPSKNTSKQCPWRHPPPPSRIPSSRSVHP
jgi:hypothetical protein